MAESRQAAQASASSAASLELTIAELQKAVQERDAAVLAAEGKVAQVGLTVTKLAWRLLVLLMCRRLQAL
jgi:hypothetical protein